MRLRIVKTYLIKLNNKRDVFHEAKPIHKSARFYFSFAIASKGEAVRSSRHASR